MKNKQRDKRRRTSGGKIKCVEQRKKKQNLLKEYYNEEITEKQGKYLAKEEETNKERREVRWREKNHVLNRK